VAGLGFIFLLVSVPFYWMLVTLFEMKLIDVILCRKGSKEGDEKNPTRQSVVSAHMSHMQSADEDIAEEVSRVKKRDPKTMPVRVEDVSKKYGTVKAVNNISFGLDNGECFALLGVSGAGKTSIFKCLTGEIYPTSG
jgi:ABC-type glutathione transport system ATPase component